MRHVRRVALKQTCGKCGKPNYFGGLEHILPSRKRDKFPTTVNNFLQIYEKLPHFDGLPESPPCIHRILFHSDLEVRNISPYLQWRWKKRITLPWNSTLLVWEIWKKELQSTQAVIFLSCVFWNNTMIYTKYQIK